MTAASMIFHQVLGTRLLFARAAGLLVAAVGIKVLVATRSAHAKAEATKEEVEDGATIRVNHIHEIGIRGVQAVLGLAILKLPVLSKYSGYCI